MRSLTLLVAVLLTTAALAIDPPKPQVPPPAIARPDIADDAKEAAAKEAAAKAEAEARAVDEEMLPPLPADMVPVGPPPARFNPTEKVRADFPVSFPIDI